MMDIALVIIFLLLGIFFFVLEIFFLPGISIAGIAGAVFFIGGIWYSFVKLGSLLGWLFVGIGLFVFLIILIVLIKGKALDKISLNKSLTDFDSLYDMDNVKVGDEGKTISRLAPIGKVLVNGNEYEAKSRDELIDPNKDIEVVAIDGQTLIVKNRNI